MPTLLDPEIDSVLFVVTNFRQVTVPVTPAVARLVIVNVRAVLSPVASALI